MITTNFSDKYSSFDMSFVNTFSSLLDALTTVAEMLTKHIDIKYSDDAMVSMHFEDSQDDCIRGILDYEAVDIVCCTPVGADAHLSGEFSISWRNTCENNYDDIAKSMNLAFDKHWTFNDFLNDFASILEAIDTVMESTYDYEEEE